MNSTLNVVIPSYSPNSAIMNRIMAFLKGFSELGVKTNVTFLTSDKKNNRVVDDMQNITFYYLWKKWPIRNRYISQVQLGFNSIRYVRNLPKGSVVFLPWPSSRLLCLLTKRKDLYVYYEETELPEIYKMRLFNINTYMESLKKIDGLFVISTALKDYFSRKGIETSKISIINMIVDTNRFVNITKLHKEKYIAYCGNVSIGKDGADDLIRSFALVHRKCPDVKLYIIGDVELKEDKKLVYELVNELGLGDNVIFTGKISYMEIPQILKNACVLALNRPDNIQARYGFPTKIGEYLLTGNPVVVTKVGDIPLFLRDGESALLALPNSPNDFASKIMWAIDNPEQARCIGEKGKKVAEDYFNYKIETYKIIQVINKSSHLKYEE